MTSKQIEILFTEKVSEYIQNGYIINTTSMAGHQGEIAKIDLRKGDEIVRVLLISDTEWTNTFTRESVKLIVGRNTEELHCSRPFDTMSSTIWNERLEVIEERTFYRPNNSADYFTEDAAEVDAMTLKRLQRYRRAERDTGYKTVTSEKAMQIALEFVRKQPRCKSIKASDITEIRRYCKNKWSEMHYVVTVKGNRTFKIS